MLSVVHIISGLGQGGAEAMLEKLILAARVSDPEIQHEVIVLGPLEVIGERLRKAGVPVESCDMTASPRSLLALARLIARLRSCRQYAVVQTWLWHADLVGGLCARIAGNRRILWNLRNSMPGRADTKRSSAVVARLCAWLSRWIPAKIICNSNAALTAHVAFGYCADKCVVIGNGFDLTRFRRSESARAELREEWGVRADELLVGLVARRDPLKDHQAFIDAATIAAAETGNVRFALIGEGVPGDDAIRLRVAQAGLSGKFILEGRRVDVPRVMSALDAFCLSSKSEGFPNVLGEAMACEVPCVTTDAGDSRALVGDDRFVAAVGDARELGACIVRLLRLTTEERRNIALAQRRKIEKDFDIEAVWRRYRDLYCAL